MYAMSIESVGVGADNHGYMKKTLSSISPKELETAQIRKDTHNRNIIRDGQILISIHTSMHLDKSYENYLLNLVLFGIFFFFVHKTEVHCTNETRNRENFDRRTVTNARDSVIVVKRGSGAENRKRTCVCPIVCFISLPLSLHPPSAGIHSSFRK